MGARSVGVRARPRSTTKTSPVAVPKAHFVEDGWILTDTTAARPRLSAAFCSKTGGGDVSFGSVDRRRRRGGLLTDGLAGDRDIYRRLTQG